MEALFSVPASPEMLISHVNMFFYNCAILQPVKFCLRAWVGKVRLSKWRVKFGSKSE